MKYVLLATATLVAAAAFSTAPAQAQSSASAAFVGVNSGGGSVRIHRGYGGDRHDGWRRPDGRDHRDGRFDDDAAIGTWVDGGEWALYNNRSWEPDSYNDWWHDRPDRAFPRWVQNKQLCERQWWSGGGWRC
jgi:hypothetical protein